MRLFPLRFGLALLAASMAVSAGHAAPPPSATLPDDVASALAQPSSAELFSLEPWAQPYADGKRLYNRAVLGSADLSRAETSNASGAVQQAIAGWDGMDPGCFDPRQALRVRTGSTSFDLLISYECHKLQVWRDGQQVAQIGIYGDPHALTDLLTAHDIPISRSGQRMSH